MDSVRRKLRDLAIDFNNAWIDWKSLCAAGKTLMQEIANDRIKILESLNHDRPSERISTEISGDLVVDVDAINEKIQEKFDKMSELLDKMDTLLAKVKRLCDSMKNMRFLIAKMSQQSPKTELIPPNLSEITETIEKQLEDDLKCRKRVTEDLAFALGRDPIMTCMAAWTHAPYLDEKFIDRSIEKLLFYSGC